ncbi:MAG: hypothetical protein IK125_02435 [Lachnospiraceae bacterium]|nr:hypothetical protein [Lachnospiraceae bacterium]
MKKQRRMKRGRNIKSRLELYVHGLYYESIMNDFLHPLFAGDTTPADGIKANMENWEKIIADQNNAIKKLK